ncbi:MAG: hypothetical protein IT303_17385 [Dehalococcoidia bacterium]|nr:hypothetical protein [Dehalococcoidia bacterium]
MKLASLPNSYISFQGADLAPNAPWRDPRVRQAVSMALDRDAMLDAAYNMKDIEKLGFTIDRVYNNEISGWEKPYWLDPTGKYQAKSDDPKITSANQAAFKYDPAGAKKMLEAAGYKDGFKTSLHTTAGRYGTAYDLLTELIQNYCGQVGIELDLKVEDYAAVFQPITAVKGEFDGLAHIPRGPGARGNLESYYLPGGTRNNARINDQVLADRIRAMLANRDGEAARKEMLNIQNYLNEKMYLVPMQLGAAGDYVGFSATVRGVNDYRVVNFDQPNETVPYYYKA